MLRVLHLCSINELDRAQSENRRILYRQNEVRETLLSLFPIYRRLPKLDVNPLVWSGPDQARPTRLGPAIIWTALLQSRTSPRSFCFPCNKLCRPLRQLHPRPCYPGAEVYKMATAAQAPATPTTTDPVQRWLARRGADARQGRNISSSAPSLRATDLKAQRVRRAPPNDPGNASRRTPFCASSPDERAATNRANSLHSTGPRTQPGKQRSSLNALRHGLTARTAVLPTEDPAAYQRHIQQFLDEYAPATPTETQLVHEIANTAWRLNRIPFLEAELLSRAKTPHTPKL